MRLAPGQKLSNLILIVDSDSTMRMRRLAARWFDPAVVVASFAPILAGCDLHH